jgi:CDP-6-deoxy-D-xylo-4-hexulose-3-dehydrase
MSKGWKIAGGIVVTAIGIFGRMKNPDIVMNRTFWVGTYPGLTNEMLDFVAESIAEYVNKG